MPERDEVIDPVLLGASNLGGRLTRNNSGTAFHPNGNAVRYGCFQPGGSDVLGWMPRLIRATDVGRTLAVFCAVECKTGRQKPDGDQARFLEVVREAGGIGLWGNDPVKVLAELRALTRG